MTIRYSQRFLRQYAAARPEVRKAFDKQSRLLLGNLNHPSLRAKKYDEALGLWQARVNRNWGSTSQSKARSTNCTISARIPSNQWAAPTSEFGPPPLHWESKPRPSDCTRDWTITQGRIFLLTSKLS
jgi:hypothetical protein